MPSSLSAAEATGRLGVSRATLYSYVSRGLIRSEAAEGKTRERRYSAEDVERLTRRKEDRRDPERTLQTALDWGAPLLDSELTLIRDGNLYYRGLDVSELSRRATLEEVAGLLWTGETRVVPLPLKAQFAHLPLLPETGLLEAFGHALTSAAARDLQAHDARPEALPATAARVLALLFAVVERRAGIPAAPDLPLHERLARAWGVPQHGDLLRRALVLVADHELNVSSFTARCVASGGAGLHHAALAGLCALQGTRHGLGVYLAAELLEDAEPKGAARALAASMRRLHHAPGFGHLLYPDGDPRARELLTVLAEVAPASPAVRAVQALCLQARSELNLLPNVDLALAAVNLHLGGAAERGVALFALGRTVGWLAHACEAARQHRLIRPRARYVGVVPGD